jgi:hypothetical protein
MQRDSLNSGHLTRRFVIVGSIAVAALQPAGTALASVLPGNPASVPPSDSLVFEVSRNGSPIGTHRLDFTRSGGETRVKIDAAFKVGFSFITLYRYRHQGEEIWRDGEFQSLDTTTSDNGTTFRVQAGRVEGGILIKATGLPDHLAPASALPLTHWAEAAMTAPLFNPQTGKMLRETAQPQGRGMVRLANGKPIEATRYALAGEAPIEDWYDSARVWAALDGKGKDGSTITYRRRQG